MIVRTKNGIILNIKIKNYTSDEDLYKIIINFKFSAKFNNDSNIENVLAYINR